MRWIHRASAWSIFGAALAVATGCASSAPEAARMTTRDLTLQSHSGTIDVRVDGAVDVPERIAPTAFKEALVASLLAAGVFSEVVDGLPGDYRLQVILGDLKQEPAGTVTVVEMTTLWTLWHGDDRIPVWQSLVSSGRTRGGSALSRQRVATEMAAKDNISEGIRQLADAVIGKAANPTQVHGTEQSRAPEPD